MRRIMTSFCWFSPFLVLFMLRNQIVASQQRDQLTMVALQQELGFSGWDTNNTDYCSWTGVHCNSNRSVERLELYGQELGGNISVISKLKSVKWIDLSFNNFYGSIPSVLGVLTQLEFLDLSANKFENSIPSQLGSLRNLRSLNLTNNLLTGNIPPQLSLLNQLVSLNLNQNSLTGKIPEELGSLERLQELQISGNYLNGSIPDWVGNLTSLKIFTAYENVLGGIIPENLGSVTSLRVLNLHSNHLEGPIPRNIFASGKLEVLILTMNTLSGNLPDSVGNCTGLSNLRIGNNRLTGSIPISIGNISSLAYFEADNNLLSGEIVAEFARCSNLTLLNLASNGFTGTVPPELGNLTNLQELIVSGNSLIGEIPLSLFKCRNLSKLDLSNNRFNGSIPEELCDMSRLQFLILDQNSFRGEIPPQIGNCMRLLELQMGGNYLTGIIPPDIGRIKNLQIALNLSFNHLHGPVPRELGKLDKLVSLDLSNNQLTGNIPSEIRGMMSLIEVNFSNNLLTGQVPIFRPFQKSPSSSFAGNKGLCGEPLNAICVGAFDPNHDEQNRHKVSYKLVLAVVGSGLTVCLTVTMIVLLFMMREKQEMAMAATASAKDGTPTPPAIITGNVFIENLKQAIDFNSVVKATLKDSNKLSSGTFSTIYKAVTPSGLILSAKRLKSMDRTVIHQQNKMIRELERLSKLCHNNLMRPIGYVIYEDVILLLHHYFPNGTLAKLLHDCSESEFEPDWPRRISVAIGVAEGLSFLHHVAIIHLDISSGNVLLDASFNPLLGEIEISMLLDPSRGTASISAVAGSFGYIPPEYAYTMQVTAPGNVYSFGVVLLEILTTRLPVDEAFGEGMDLVKWVHNASARGETPEQILDSRLSTVSFAWRKQMLGVLKVALLCTDMTPAKRPKMKKVVEMLEEVNQN